MNLKVNEFSWNELKSAINKHLKEDSNITDVNINYQFQKPPYGTKNILSLNVVINE